MGEKIKKINLLYSVAELIEPIGNKSSLFEIYSESDAKKRMSYKTFTRCAFELERLGFITLHISTEGYKKGVKWIITTTKKKELRNLAVSLRSALQAET